MEFLGADGFFSRISAYAFACVRVANLAPYRSYSTGISRSSMSGIALVAPLFASLSLSSFPIVPLWPLTHCRVVLAEWCLSKWIVFRKSWAFFIFIHPSFSQVSRCVIRPSITYLESETILRGQNLGVELVAAVL